MDLEWLVEIVHMIVEVSEIILELMGVVILVLAGVRGFLFYLAEGDESVRLKFANKISLALEYLMAAEILHTVILEKWEELVIIGAIIVFRAVLTWEIGKEEKELEEKAELRKLMFWDEKHKDNKVPEAPKGE